MLPGSGKVDPQKVRLMLLDKIRDSRGRGDSTAVPMLTSTRQAAPSSADDAVRQTTVDLNTADMEPTNPAPGRRERRLEGGRPHETYKNTEISRKRGCHPCYVAVVLPHERRRSLASHDRGVRIRRTVSLIDLYLHPAARSLAVGVCTTVGRYGDQG